MRSSRAKSRFRLILIVSPCTAGERDLVVISALFVGVPSRSVRAEGYLWRVAVNDGLYWLGRKVTSSIFWQRFNSTLLWLFLR
jgi:hypothetical protein